MRCWAWSARPAPARTTCCRWRGAAASWTGRARASTTSSRNASRSWATSKPRQEPGRTRPRTVYSLTEQGRDALREWAATPVTVTPLKSEPLLRLLIADLVGEEVTREALATLREDLADLNQRLDASEAAAETLPHRAPYLLAANRFLRGFVALHEELIDALPAPD